MDAALFSPFKRCRGSSLILRKSRRYEDPSGHPHQQRFEILLQSSSGPSGQRWRDTWHAYGLVARGADARADDDLYTEQQRCCDDYNKTPYATTRIRRDWQWISKNPVLSIIMEENDYDAVWIAEYHFST